MERSSKSDAIEHHWKNDETISLIPFPENWDRARILNHQADLSAFIEYASQFFGTKEEVLLWIERPVWGDWTPKELILSGQGAQARKAFIKEFRPWQFWLWAL
ncbi:MAG: hypothetical protein HC852_01650 [Acaryochloridaceae cyanobacterium RU_4_10]|nr:hypothetical protein [Acaryochloridaceae cyanobacterium RU_4_10]